MQQHAASFIAHTEASELPRFIKDEFDAFLECGFLAQVPEAALRRARPRQASSTPVMAAPILGGAATPTPMPNGVRRCDKHGSARTKTWPLTVPTVLDPTKAFVSYSRGDADFVQRLCKDLRSAGASVWLDTLDIQPGETWDQEVERALRECGRMIVVLSPRSVTSQNVLDEVGYALSRKRPVIPALYRDCEIPFRLDRIQYADFRFDHDKGLRETLQALGAPTVPTPPVDLRRKRLLATVAAAAGVGLSVWALWPKLESPASYRDSYRSVLTRYVADAPDGFRALGAREFQDWTPSVVLPGAESCRGFGFPREPVIECVVYRTMSEVDAANRFEDLIELTRAALPAWEGNRLNMFNAYFSSKNDAATIGLGVSRVADRYDVEVSVRPAPK